MFSRCCYCTNTLKLVPNVDKIPPARFVHKSAIQNSRRRVVVTGIGVVSPIGCSTETAWQSILNKTCGIKQLSAGYETLPCKIAAKIDENELKLSERFSKSDLRALSPATAYAMIAGKLKAFRVQKLYHY